MLKNSFTSDTALTGSGTARPAFAMRIVRTTCRWGDSHPQANRAVEAAVEGLKAAKFGFDDSAMRRAMIQRVYWTAGSVIKEAALEGSKSDPLDTPWDWEKADSAKRMAVMSAFCYICEDRRRRVASADDPPTKWLNSFYIDLPYKLFSMQVRYQKSETMLAPAMGDTRLHSLIAKSWK